MSSSDRRTVLAGLALGGLALSGLGLSGCGFRPAHAPGGTGPALQGRVRARDPVTRGEFQFLAAFEDRLGRPADPQFALSYRIAVTRSEGGRIQGLGATRIVLSGRLDYTLDAVAGPGATPPRAAGQVAAQTAFSNTASQLAAQTAEEDAEARLMRMLADALADRLLADPRLAG